MSDLVNELLDKVSALTQTVNQVIAGSKSVPELPTQETLDATSLIPVSRDGVSEKITVQQIVNAAVNNDNDQLITIGEITLDGNDLTIDSISGKINNVIQFISTPTVINIPFCGTGLNRIDLIVYDNSNNIVRIPGTETAGSIIIAPIQPLETLLITPISVSDTLIGEPEAPIVGASYIKKSFDKIHQFTATGTNVVIPFHLYGYSTIELSGDLTSVSGFSFTDLIANPAVAEYPHDGKSMFIINRSGHDITLKNADFASLAVVFFAFDGGNIVIPNDGKLEIKYKADSLIDVLKSWTTTDDVTGLTGALASKIEKTQKNYYELAKSCIKKYHTTYDGSMLYRKFGNIISSLVPITNTKFMYADFIKDANDDFIKLGEVGYCDIIEQEIFSEKLNGTLTGTFNTTSYNSFTTQVGATISISFTGSSIYLNYYSDNRGGIWQFALNTGETISLSTWESVGTTKLTKIFDVSYGTYTITATFMGADPLHAPTGGTARGWFVYNSTNALYRTFSIYDFGYNTSNKTLVLNGSSNKEFAITVKRVGTSDVEQWIPQHTTYGTVFGTSSFLIDNVDFTSLPNRAVYLGCDNVELLQDMQAKNPTDSIYLANILTSHLINKNGIVFNGTIEFTEPTYSTNGYVCMLPINTATFGTKLLDGFGNSYDILLSDGSDTISPHKDNLISLGVIDNNEDYFLGVDYLGSDETFLKGIGNYKTFTNGMSSRFWVQHRDANLNKFYAQTYSAQTIPDNFTHHFNFRMMIGNLKNAYRQLQKDNITN